MDTKLDFKLALRPSQLETLKQFPKHPSVLSSLGIQLPEGAIVVIGRHDIKILLSSQKQRYAA